MFTPLPPYNKEVKNILYLSTTLETSGIQPRTRRYKLAYASTLPTQTSITAFFLSFSLGETWGSQFTTTLLEFYVNNWENTTCIVQWHFWHLTQFSFCISHPTLLSYKCFWAISYQHLQMHAVWLSSTYWNFNFCYANKAESNEETQLKWVLLLGLAQPTQTFRS